jgi:hypothetical protein
MDPPCLQSLKFILKGGNRGGQDDNNTSSTSVVSSSTASVVASSTTSTAAAATSSVATGQAIVNPGNVEAAQTSLTLDPEVIMKGLEQNGQAVQEAGQVPSLTSTNNL